MTKLNLGSGTSRHQDYLSVDLHTEADLKHDLTDPLPYLDNSVDNIYSSHAIEHFTRAEWEAIRKDWARVLKPGGTIEIHCPDMTKLCRNYLTDPSDARLMQIYGWQERPGEFHKNGFTEQTLADSFPGFKAKVLEPASDYDLHMLLTKPAL